VSHENSHGQRSKVKVECQPNLGIRYKITDDNYCKYCNSRKTVHWF